jgi:glucose-1-phosphate thymidylyltransferase
MIGCIEEIAYRNGWISKQKLEEIAKKLSKTDYGEYLIKILKE